MNDIKTNIKEDAVTYSLNGENYRDFVMYDKNIEGKRPAILVIPEWWGLNNYSKSRARQLAELGYIAMAADMYGNNKLAANHIEAGELASVYYKNPELTKVRLDAAMEQLKKYPETDRTKMGAIGYCFGGFVVLNAAKLGADLTGVVSFHGGLTGVKPQKDLLKAKVLVCHRAADEFENPHVADFKKQMDAIDADYAFKTYANASHAFSNPEATANGEKFNMPIRYNEAADIASWDEMKKFFEELF